MKIFAKENNQINMSNAKTVLDDIDSIFNQYDDGPGFSQNKKGQINVEKEDFLDQLKKKFCQLDQMNLTVKERERKSQLYKYYRSLSR